MNETITQIGASIVKVEVKSDSISVAEGGQQILTVVGVADVDESVLEKRIEKLREDKSAAEEVSRLALENKRLRNKLDARIRGRRSKRSSAETHGDEDTSSEKAIRKKLRKNEMETDAIFNMETLVEKANKRADQRDKNANKMRRQWGAMLDSMVAGGKVKVDVSRIELSEDGSSYSGEYSVRWAIPDDELTALIRAKGGNNNQSRYTVSYQDVADTEEFAVYLKAQELAVEVLVGDTVLSRHRVLANSGYFFVYFPTEIGNPQLAYLYVSSATGVQCKQTCRFQLNADYVRSNSKLEGRLVRVDRSAGQASSDETAVLMQ